MKPKIRQIRPKDLKALNEKVPGVRFPPNQDRAQIRGGKRSFAKKLTSNSKPSEEER